MKLSAQCDTLADMLSTQYGLPVRILARLECDAWEFRVGPDEGDVYRVVQVAGNLIEDVSLGWLYNHLKDRFAEFGL